jgi:hypothetical protein
MTKKDILKLAVETFISSTDIIIQYGGDGDTCVFKLHKLECPKVKISLSLNKEVVKQKELHIDDAFPLLVDAITMAVNN